MRISGKALLAGVAAIALAGSCGLALAHAPALHTMTVQMPNGGTARIEYTGNVAPRVTFGTAPSPAAFFAPASPFAMLDRISAEMDREMVAMRREAGLMPMPFADPNPLFDADLRNLPAGASSYSMAATFGGNGACMRSMEITSNGSAKPKVVTHSAGNCTAAGKPGWSSANLSAATQSPPRTADSVYNASYRTVN